MQGEKCLTSYATYANKIMALLMHEKTLELIDLLWLGGCGIQTQLGFINYLKQRSATFKPTHLDSRVKAVS